MGKKITFEEFVERAEKCHGKGRYDYSMAKDEYMNVSNKVTIKCNKCGFVFQQKPYHHLAGKGCIKCGFIISAAKRKKYDFNDIKNIIEDNHITTKKEFRKCFPSLERYARKKTF